jgi:hypothetical protein
LSGEKEKRMKRNNEFVLPQRTVFITGSEKNAGKTTFLNHALKSLRTETTPAFLTIGIDGETKDIIFGNPKPQIYTEPGDLFVTSDLMIARSGGVFEIREVFPVKTVLGRLVLLKTLRGGFIELVGPEDNEQLSKIISYIKEEEGCQTILIDGAVNRITQVATGIDAGFVFVVKISQQNFKSGLEKIKRLSILEKIPKFNEDTKGLEVWFHKGALTETSIHKIPDNIKTVVVEDFTKIFLSLNQLKDLQNKKELFFRDVFDLLFVVVNLSGMKREEFLESIAGNDITDKIVFNPYQKDR